MWVGKNNCSVRPSVINLPLQYKLVTKTYIPSNLCDSSDSNDSSDSCYSSDSSDSSDNSDSNDQKISPNNFFHNKKTFFSSK